MTVLYAISIDSGTDAQNAAIRNEMEAALGCNDDPLDLLIAAEEGNLRAIALVDPENPMLDDHVLFWGGL